jgi:hypothetical protein
MVTVDDMLKKVLKLRFSKHNVFDATKFPYLVEESYLENRWEIGPLGKPIAKLVQWITGLYNSRIMNLLDISHFARSKNLGLCIKQFLSQVHGNILCMDRLVQLDVALITKITGLPTVGACLEEYLENKARENEIVELVKEQFGTIRGNRGIMLRDINDNATRFTSKIMACNMFRKCRKEETPKGVIEVAV